MIWTASYPPVLGGLQTVTQQLAHGLSDRGHEVVVLTNRYPKHLPEFEVSNKVKVFRVLHARPNPTDNSVRGYVSFLKNKLRFQQSQNKITKIIKDFNPDIINIHFPDSQIPYWSEVKKWVKCKLVVSTHGHEILKWFRQDNEVVLDSQKTINSIQKRIKNELTGFLSDADAITACSGWMLQKTVDLIGSNNSMTAKIVTYNTVDTERFLGKESGSRAKPQYIFSFGRLASHKGFDLLISAFSEIKKRQVYPLRLIIGGDGDEQKKLKDLIQHFGLESDVILTGRLSPEEVVAYLQDAELIVIPSKREPFGISVIESLCSANSVVATNIGGIPEAAGSLAILCDPSTPSLINGIEKGLRQKVTDSQMEERRKHLLQFSMESFLNRYEKALFLQS
ncbi:glycosyltransferase family 4 protein [Phaeodactylibacter xiamenensis]|uniref:glycosyltransferase family 4 protein n=1 Tax=Phaeodactylibacter xiamenensis TaxID=1524460 RepID=UPI003CCBFA23